MSDILDLKGRTALITGGGQGVGRAAALLMAEHNAGAVVVNDYHLDRAESVAEEIRAKGGKALAVQADVSDLDSVKAMFAKANEAFGHVDVLVNNAGNAGATPEKAARGVPYWEVGPEVWQNYIGVNFYGVIHCTSQVVAGMIERRQGSIVTVISDAGRWGDPNMEIYAASKAGAAGFMRSTARTLGRYGVRANSVAIAATMSPSVGARLQADPERLKKMMQNYVIRRPGQPEDIANMILFLASDASSWVTGQTYPVNGGFTFGL